MKVKEDAPVSDAAAQRSFSAAERLYISNKGIDAHLGEGIVDPRAIQGRNAAQVSLCRASDHQAPGHASIGQAK